MGLEEDYQKLLENDAVIQLDNSIRHIENAGVSIITKNLHQGIGKLKWLIREESLAPTDSGWRAFGTQDSEEYIQDSSNLMLVDFNNMANLDTMIFAVYRMPVGTKLEYHHGEEGKYFLDINTNKRLAWQSYSKENE